MNAADSIVDVEEMHRQADALELQALRAKDRKQEKLYIRVRKLRADAKAIQQRVAAYVPAAPKK